MPLSRCAVDYCSIRSQEYRMFVMDHKDLFLENKDLVDIIRQSAFSVGSKELECFEMIDRYRLFIDSVVYRCKSCNLVGEHLSKFPRNPSCIIACTSKLCSLLEILRCFCRNFQSDNDVLGFYRFAASSGRQHYLQFCYLVYLFKTTNFSNLSERVAVGKNICDLYLIKNAPHYLYIPVEMRDIIFKDHLVCNLNIMDDAVLWVMNTLSQFYWQTMLTTESIFSTAVIGSNIHLFQDSCEVNKCNRLSVSKIKVVGDIQHEMNQELPSPPISPVTSSPKDSGTLIKAEELHQTNRRSSIQWLRGSMHNVQQLVLKDIINNASACSVFKEFLEKENASHLLTFLLEVEECRGITVPGFRVVYFKQIYFKYLVVFSCIMRPDLIYLFQVNQ